jgi:hypothetical protein
MANNTSTFTLKLKTEGMEQAQAGSKQIRENFEGAQRAASATKVARSAAAQPTGRAGASAGVFTGTEVEDYNRASGAAGKAGGTARDFADQARGLGGLVRLYATVAANAFAAAAAFGALSRAMDTTNMVKGLDQLGAASGVALGNLSKRLFLATDGAVSLREAMEATAKATGAGLSSDQILKLGDVAKKASQTLGVNMADALSRLSRGITKLEPELLDELGIFVKIDDAASKYALSVGKSTSALTDFERRQAFANAVLEQGNKKFGEVNIDINPYTKLAATFQNLTQTILEFINKGLAPIAKIFADNSVLLGAAFAFIATKVLKMAIPALGEWQGQLVKTAEMAKEKAQAINTAFGEAWVDRWETRLKLPELRAGVKTATEELRKVALPAGMSKNVEAGYAALLRGEDMSKTQANATTRALGLKRKELETLGDVQDRQGKKQKVALESEIRSLERIVALNKQRQTLSSAETKIETAAGKQPGFMSGEAARNRVAKGASTTAIALGELAAIPGQTMEKGFMDAMKSMKTNLEKQGVGFIKRWSTLAVGALASATTAIGTLIASIQMWIGVFMAVGFAIYGALKYFSATKKESELTTEAMTRLDDASKSAALTLEKLAMSKDPLESLNVQTIQARANALKELGDSAALAVKRAFDEISKMNPGDQFLNFISKLWGGDVQTKLSEGLSDSIKNAFKLAENTQLTAESKKSLEAIVGTSINSTNLDKTLKALADSGDTEKLKQVAKIIETMGSAAAVSAAKGTELKESFAKVTTGIQEFNRSVLPTDNLSKIAQDSAVAAQKLGIALNDPVQALTAMKDVSSSVDMLSIFPADVAKNLMSYSTELTNIANKTVIAKKQSQDYDKQIDQLNSRLEQLQSTGFAEVDPITRDQIADILAKIGELEKKKINIKASIEADTSKFKGVFDDAVRASLIQSADLMAARLAAEMNKARTAVMSTIAGLLGDTAGGIKMRADIEKQAIDASVEVAQQSFNLGTKMEELKIEMERKRLQDEQIALMSSRDSRGQAERTKRIEAIGKSLENLDKLEGVIKSGFRGPSSQQLARQGGTPEMVSARQRFEGFGVTLAGARSQKQAVDTKTAVELERNRFQQSQKDYQLTVDAANIEKQRLETLSNIYGIENLTLLNKKIAQENAAQNLADTKQRNELEASVVEKAGLYTTAIVEAAKAKKSLTDEQKKNFADTINQAQAEVERFNTSVEQRKKAKDLADDILRISSQTAGEQKKLDFDKQRSDAALELQQISLNINKQEFDSLASRGRLEEEYVAERTAQFAKEAQQLQYLRQLSDATSQKKLQDLQAEDQFKKALAAGDTELAATIARDQQLARNNALFADRIRIINDTNNYAQRGIDIEKDKAIEMAKTNKLLETQKERAEGIASLGDSLAAAFGRAGTALSGLVNTLDNIIANQETYNSELARQYDIMDSSRAIMDDPTKGEKEKAAATNAYNKAKQETNRLDKKNTQDELNNNIKLIGAAKGLFKEKTAGYKILSGIEKAMHVYKMAMWAKETAADLARTMSSSSNALVRGLADGAAAVAKTLSSIPFPANLAAAAAVAAVVKSLFGEGPSAPPTGFTAEEQQKVQGTGQFYRDGKLVETGAGVLGDATAKSKSVENAIQNMEQYDFKNLEYNNKMLEALKGIRKNTENLAGNLLKSIPGLNIKPETIKSGNWLLGKDTTEVLDQGIKIIGTIGQIIDQSAQLFKYTNTKTTSSSFFGLFKDVSYDPQATRLQSGPLQRDLSLIFKDVGTALGEAAETLGMGTATQIMDGFRSIDLSEQFKQISLMDLKPDEMVEALMSVVSSGMDTAALQLMPSLDKFRKAGESFADTVMRVANDTRVVKLSFEELGMTLPKLAEQGARPTQEQLNRLTNAQSAYNAALAATKAVSGVAITGEGGEQYTEVIGSPEATAALASALIELTSAQSAVTVTTNSLTTRNLDLVQSYIDAAGGLDEFVERNRFFAENFLTEAERLAPVQERVNKEIARLAPQLANLGITAGSNRDQFKQAVFAAEALGESGVQLYNDLMKLAPAFDMVTQEAQSAALSVADFSKRVLSNEVDIIKMQASLLEKSGDFQKAYTKLQESVLLTRQSELIELEKLPKAQKDVLKYQLEYKWSLEDLASQTENNVKINNQLITSQQNLVSYLDEALGLLNQALRLRGEGIDAQGIERTLKLQDLSAKYSGKENEVRLRVLTGLQKYIWALEDEETAKQAYVKALQTQAQALQREIAEIDKILDQRSTIDQLKALTAADKDQAQSRAKTLARERELLQIRNEYDKSVVGAIVANQVYINALEDEKELRDRLVEAHNKEKDAIESTISTIKDAIKSIKDYRNSLMFSSELSVMTPEQQYKEARKIFEETLTTARTPGVDEAGTKAQQEALSKIPEVSNKFLELSRTLFASSGSYMTDYQVVQNALTMTEAALGEQLTEAEQQLAELKVISDALGSIEENTKTAAELFLEYGRAQAVSSAAATAASAADGRDTKDLDALRNSKLDELKTVNDKIRDLGERQLTSIEAATAATKAGSEYQAAVANTTKALNDISADVTNGTIRQAIEARQAATETISELRLANDYLNTILINTYANYQTQRQHFQNLMTSPQDVNVTGGAVTTILAAIAANTAKTADNVTNVQTAVSAGTNAVVRNNTATSDQTATVVAEAVQTVARGSDWKAVTLPVVQSSGTVIAVTRER